MGRRELGGREAGGGRMEWMITGSSGGSMEEGLETRLRGACPASDKGRKNAAVEVSRVF